MILFIISEVLFFVSFFWSFFHFSLAPNIEVGNSWPPIRVIPFNFYEIPLLNTLILLVSGGTVTWSHMSFGVNKHSINISSLLMTIILGGIFTLLQYYEYQESSYSITDASFGSSFFLTTGFHGIHVIVGRIFLGFTWYRLLVGCFSKYHYFGFEAASWYWHFVDVV